jgi:hypothetical protein
MCSSRKIHYVLFKGVTRRSVCLLLFACISDDNIPYIPRKNIHFPHHEPVVEARYKAHPNELCLRDLKLRRLLETQ